MQRHLSVERTLPSDGTAGCLVGRVWLPGDVAGPAVVAVQDRGLVDLTSVTPTMSALLERDDRLEIARRGNLPIVCSLDALIANASSASRDTSLPWPLAPVDLQALKAAGVTFVRSMLERVIEEKIQGDPTKAQALRVKVEEAVGGSLRSIVPGSAEAQEVKRHLEADGLWSQYLEVGIGPDAEIFTKSQPMAAVGTGAAIGIHKSSSWNNPEPEIVLCVNSTGTIVGATLGNDVNLRDIEGRSALLLGRAKDNNGSCALGPFIRLFDDTYGIEDVRRAEVGLRVEGSDGFVLEGSSSMSEISRGPTDLVAQMINTSHQYPDGAVLFCGTMFAPIQDRDAPGQGFTHHVDDVVVIACKELGALVNRVDRADLIDPWTFGTRELMGNLARRGLLG